MENVKKIDTFGLLNVFFCSTGGNSRNIAYDFAKNATDKGFVPCVSSLADVNRDEFIHSDLCVFFLSTYGVGGPPEDGAAFFEWLKDLAEVKEQVLKGMRFIMFGLGNSGYEFFCGMSKKTRALLLSLGAKELCDLTCSDMQNEPPFDTYLRWKEIFSKVIDSSPEQFPKRLISTEEIARMKNPYTVKTVKEEIQNWTAVDTAKVPLSHEMKAYLETPELDVLEIRELRKEATETKSTLFIRLKNKGLELFPGCNVEIFPENSFSEGTFTGSIVVENQSKGKVPFPPMPLSDFYKLLNIEQKLTRSYLQDALLHCKDPAKESHYQELLKKEDFADVALTCKDITKDLDVPLSEQIKLGINKFRPYTLSGWEEGEIHLLVSILHKNGKYGLCSNFFRNRPKKIKVRQFTSNFKAIEGTDPIVMIANGSGMAPFRSMLHFTLAEKKAGRPYHPLVFYFGCQKKGDDFYFREEWEKAEEEGVVELHVATSQEAEKEHIQDAMKRDMDNLFKLMFERKAYFLICGSVGLAKDVSMVFMELHKRNGIMPYQALMKVKSMESEGRILKEVFD